MKNKTLHCILFLALYSACLSQTDSNIVLRFDFNDHQFKEVNGIVTIKPVGVTLTEDRFGNKHSAAYLQGNTSSYLNLGSSDLLKLKKGTLSFWVNIQAVVLAGKGYRGNPLFLARNAATEDFNLAFGVGYSVPNNRFGVQSSKDSIQEATIFAKDTVNLNTWYHILITIDNNHLALHVNGELQERLNKQFETNYLAGDSVIVGRSLGYKNERYSNAIVDDIRFYHRVLRQKEIENLYTEPNPNRFKNIISEVVKYGLIVIVLGITITIIIIRNRRNLKKQKDHYELNNRVKELEIKVIKTQMNPHFISNCLAAIQNLIYSGQIDKAGEYLAKFSLFLRQILDYSDKTYLTLGEELTIIKLNIELEQLRFKNEFNFKLEIEEEIPLNEILIPSLITQPFIENAIWHGLLPLNERSPRLIVKIYKQNGKIYIAIEDNGVGRQESGMVPLKKSRGTKLAADKIESINRLRNSPDYQLEIIDLTDEKQQPAGTRIIIQLSPFSLDE